jgi:hypothetical protein
MEGKAYTAIDNIVVQSARKNDNPQQRNARTTSKKVQQNFTTISNISGSDDGSFDFSNV